MQSRSAARRAYLFGLLVALALSSAAHGVAYRVAHATPGRQDAYPAQATAEPLAPLATAPAYPPPALEAAATPAPIGAPESDPNAGIIAVPESVPEPLPVVATDGRGVLYLWLGFVATLLIFGASVIGAVMIFTRRVES